MPPARRRGANRAADKRKLSIGDLVLAKVKGFPAWPAQISRPEDWKRSPDPKKYFVQFFGTSEIAFVAPVDIQPFTNESRIKLAARAQSKKVKYFARAVEEISEAYEELQKEGSQKNLEGGTEKEVDFPSTSVDRVQSKIFDDQDVLDQEEFSEKKEISNIFTGNELTGLERCSRNRDVGDFVDHDQIGPLKMKSPNSPLKTKRKPSDNDTRLPKGGKVKLHESGSDTLIKENQFRSLQHDVKKEKIVDMPSDSTIVSGLNISLENECMEVVESGDMDAALDNEKLRISAHSCEPVENGHVSGSIQTQLKHTKDSSLSSRKLDTESKHQNISIDKHNNRHVNSNDKWKGSSSSKTDTGRSNDKGTRQVKIEKNISQRKDELLKRRLNVGGRVGASEEKIEVSLSHEGHKDKKADIKKRKMAAAVEDSHPPKRSKLSGEATHAFEKIKKVTFPIVDGDRKAQEKKSTPSVKDENKKSASFVEEKKNLSVESKKFNSDKAEKKKIPTSVKAEKGMLLKSDVTGIHSRINESAPSVKPKELLQNPSYTPKRSGVLAEKVNEVTKKEISLSAHEHSPMGPFQGKRRTFRLDDTEDDVEGHRTPVHRKQGNAMVATAAVPLISIGEVSMSQEMEDQSNLQPNAEVGGVDKQVSRASEYELVESDKPDNDGFKTNHSIPVFFKEEKELNPDQGNGAVSIGSPIKPQLPRTSLKEHLVSTSPEPNEVKKSKPNSIGMQAKVSGSSGLKKTQASSFKGPATTPIKIGTSSKIPDKHNGNLSLSKEKVKTSQKILLRVDVIPENRANINFSAECSLAKDSLLQERFGTFDNKAGSSSHDQFTESISSMKHLIAIAQAKRKETQLQITSHDSNAIYKTSPDPTSLTISYLPPNSVDNDIKDSITSTPFGTPPAYSRVTSREAESDGYENAASPPRTVGRSLSGGTEAAVARDALEGMIEMLSRTKDSIGRATRLAIDCAKYGIASEVVELLIRKLESEPSFHRRVDLFFLVDSITQCSHSQKGIASVSYVPAIQAALPRLLGAAAPPGSGARENRRQCIKVLKIWIDRKVMPESVLRRFIEDIEVPNQGSTSGVLKRPSRAERSIDDPIREMDGILVDEYGSNASFQMPILFSSNIFEDEDLHISSKEIGDTSPAEAKSVVLDVIPEMQSDQQQYDMEDVCELEMEDALLSCKEEPKITEVNFLPSQFQHQCSESHFQSSLTSETDNFSPPLPLDSPPFTPPLPPSPPPTPPPPPSSPSPPPPPPPPLPSGPPPLPPPPSEPSSPSIAYQASLTQGSHILSGSTLGHGHINIPMNNDPFQPQSNSYGATGPGSLQAVSDFSYLQSDPYVNPQASHTSIQFPQGCVVFPQRPYHSNPSQAPTTGQLPINQGMPPVQAANPYAFANTVIQQQIQPPFQAHPLVSISNGPRHSVGEDQWRAHSGVPHAQEGFYMSNVERPCSSSLGLQRPMHPPLPTGGQIAGHGGPATMVSRPDMHQVSCWRPS